MPRKRRYSTEQIITKLREADVLLSQGRAAEEIARMLEINKQTYYRWRKEYGGLKWSYDFMQDRTHNGVPLSHSECDR